jgi:hypothetical protein
MHNCPIFQEEEKQGSHISTINEEIWCQGMATDNIISTGWFRKQLGFPVF